MEQSLATELLQEIKKHSKRWFIAFLVSLGILIISNIVWVFVFGSYCYVNIDADNGNATYMNGEGDVNTEHGSGGIDNGKD